jgi:sugar lactone lactonase YvrE
METDSNGVVYMGNFEQSAVVSFSPANGTVSTFVRDPRINWVDTCESLSPDPTQFLASRER